MKPKKARNLIYFLYVIGLIFILFSQINMIFLLIGVIAAGSSAVLNLLYYKCPHCGKHLGRNGGDYCPHCGENIDD